MLYLKLSLNAWQSDDFNTVFMEEIENLNAEVLPLQQGLRYSSYALNDNISSSILNISNNKETIMVKVGLFYTGVIAGCNCADDPTPMDVNNEYCNVIFTIDKKTAAATITLFEE